MPRISTRVGFVALLDTCRRAAPARACSISSATIAAPYSSTMRSVPCTWCRCARKTRIRRRRRDPRRKPRAPAAPAAGSRRARLDPAQGGEVDVVFQLHRVFRRSALRCPDRLLTFPPAYAGSLKSATDRRRSCASCARLPIDSAVWLAPTDVCVGDFLNHVHRRGDVRRRRGLLLRGAWRCSESGPRGRSTPFRSRPARGRRPRRGARRTPLRRWSVPSS